MRLYVAAVLALVLGYAAFVLYMVWRVWP